MKVGDVIEALKSKDAEADCVVYCCPQCHSFADIKRISNRPRRSNMAVGKAEVIIDVCSCNL